VRGYLFFVVKKYRIYAACGVSQTPEILLNDHRLKAGGLFRAEAQTLRLKVALGAKAPSFPD